MDVDDFDSLLDDELEIMNELENETDKENTPSQFGKSLNSVNVEPLPPSIPSLDCGIGKKRQRPPPEFESESTFGDSESAFGIIETSPFKLSPARKKIKPLYESGANKMDDDSSAVSTVRIPKLGERKVYRKPPADSFQSVTTALGERFYLRLKTDDKELATKKLEIQPVGLCDQPFLKVYEEATKIISESEEVDQDATDGSFSTESSVTDTDLWVEKFKPRVYFDLLSDEGTNRTLLHWLKLWDRVVFNKEIRKVESEPDENIGKKGKINLPVVINDLDDVGRPMQKLAILHGPPGLGKTTLAHVVASHAGYKVIEMNASDDRSVDAFKKKLESATQMRSVVASDNRPNCLIIDEIDGTPAPTINYLVSILSGKAQTKKSKGMQILRPIICICNDIFTPALRALKQIALVVPFTQTAPSKLALRLKEIANKENMAADLSTMLALCKKTDYDIRSCLSTLQFFKKRSVPMKMSDVASIAVGTKDSQKGLFAVWDEIFSEPSKSVEIHNKSNPFPRSKKILTSISSCGDYERQLSGVFENYLTRKFKDSGLEAVVKGCEWIVHSDLLQQEIMHSQIYSLMGHLPYPLLASHFLFSSGNKSKIAFPTQSTECRNKVNQSNGILDSLMTEMPACSKIFCSRRILVNDLLPALLVTIQPPLRPINTQLYSNKEKADFENLIKIHIEYNLTYQQERNMEGQFQFNMDPDVERVVHFPEIKRLYQLSYACKQKVAHEIEFEKMRRVNPQVPEEIPAPKKPVVEENAAKLKTTSHLATLTPKTITVKESVATDFFGRVIKINPEEKKANVWNDDIVKTDLWFKFKEGYSNAVRRKVKIKDFF